MKNEKLQWHPAFSAALRIILRNQIDTIPKSELSFFEYTKTPMVRAFSVMSDAPS